MPYNIREAAQSLMVEEEELLEILDIYFMETRDSLAECESALKTGNCDALTRLFHAMKGSASNFRMNDLSRLAEEMESGAKSGELGIIGSNLPIFRKEFESNLKQVEGLKK